MTTFNTQILTSNCKNPIYYIYHLSDINIHCDKRHVEYKQIFCNFISNILTENTAVVITGNLLNTKNRITPQEIILAREFIFNISLKCPIVIIPGNHDKNENINAIIFHLNLPMQNINYINEKGCYSLNNINFIYITEAFDNNLTNFPKNQYNIGLYHGVVGKCILYNGKYSNGKLMPISTFDNFDYTLLGGITNMQFIDTHRKIGYSGSMIQKDYNEDWNNHGYLLWDIKNNNVTHTHLNNNYRYVTFNILDGKLMTPLIDLPNNLYVKWDINESGIGMENSNDNKVVNEIQNEIRIKYNVEEEIYVHTSFVPDIPEVHESKYVFDLSIEKQKEYAISWLSSEGKILTNDEKECLYTLINKYNNKVATKEIPYIKWKLIDLEFENILCYSTKQKIIFDELKGVHGIIAQNNAGKSAIFDILVFSLFGKSTRTDTYSYNDLIYSTNINNESKNLLCILCFEDINTKDKYKITRESKGDELKSKCCVIIEKNGIVLHDGSTREANTYITSLLGTYDDFMTITFMAQNNCHNFLLMSGKTQKEFTSRVFQLDIYDTFHKLSKNDIKNYINNINFIKEKNISIEEEDIPNKLTILKSTLENILINKKELENEVFDSNIIKENITNTLQPLFQDNVKTTIHLLKQLNLKNMQNIDIYKNKKINIIETYKTKFDFNTSNINQEQILLNNQLQQLLHIDTDILMSDINNIWINIQELFNVLNEANGKKIKTKKSNYNISSYNKLILLINKKIDKNIKINLNLNLEKDLEITIDILKEELIELINSKPTNKIFINLEKAKDKYSITYEKDILFELEKNINLEEINLNDTLTKINLFNKEINIKLLNINTEQIKINELKLQEFNNTLRIINDKLKIINKAKDRLINHKYDIKCDFCCNNQLVLDARNDMCGEDEILNNYKNINNLIEDLFLKNNLIKLLYSKGENEKNINNIKIAVNELKESQILKNTIKEFDENILIKNNEIKKIKKEIKLIKSFNIIQNNVENLKKLKETFILFHNNLTQNILYNDTLDETKNIINLKLKQLSEYITLENTLIQTEKDIERINKEIQVKEQNLEIKTENDKIKKTLTLLLDLIDNNNVKIINFIKKETELNFNIVKYENIIIEFNKNKLKLTELESEINILEHFIAMSHHNGIPSYLFKQISSLLQDNVNLILSEYSDMKVKIKNEGKETSIQIWNDKYKNGLNTKMLCGSEQFLVELSFRVAFQTLSNVSKPNFFICDEGWSCLDEKTRSQLNRILTTLLEYNEYILTVSHIDDVRKWMNNYIKITIDNLHQRYITQ
jgi:DNA repair exonuclease SbcCD ATPase subunit